jgi:D-alanyl-D-alanine carboxypeptidase
MITTAQAIKDFGKPNQQGSYLTTIDLPYPMRLAWDKKTTVRKMRCHKLVAQNFHNVFTDLLAHYGLEKIQELGIDLFGGCFNFRAMRGGSDYSRHSWGIAIDLDPERNQLHETKATARFARPEYNDLHRIFEKNGFENMGKVMGYDFMHWQIKYID